MPYADPQSEATKQKMREASLRYRARHPEYVESMKRYNKEYWKNHKEEIVTRGRERRRQRKKIRWANDISFKLKENYRKRISEAIKRNGVVKNAKTIELLGCSVEQFRQHLEDKFYVNARTGQEMTWGNYGLWHVDHIRPCASFDLTDPQQQLECFNFKNLQPLWAFDNLSKRDSTDREFFTHNLQATGV